ncbi:eCIS core domain-containing protein [Amycolatopsis sp. NPDC054798]
MSSPGPGSPLGLGVAGPLTRGFGVDVSPVRVHTDTRAATAAAALGVRAFTWGTDVFLGAGQRPNDLGLLAHEVSHSIQQSGGPAVQLFDGPHGHLETEAHQASAAIVRGETVTVTGRTGSASVQREERPWYSRAIDAAASLGTGALDTALNFVKERAHSIPGYDLLGVILGRDPITRVPVARTAANLIRGVLGFVPGGTTMFDNLQQSGAVQRAYEWFSAEIDKLGLTWEYIRGLFQRAWDALSVTDLVNPGSAWEKLRGVFSAPLARIRDFAVAAGKKVLEFVFEGALALAGSAGRQVLAIFRRIGGAFDLIVADPVRFLGNLLRAVLGGFRQFGANILAHLRTGIFEWLVGALRGAVTLPAKWDFAGILDVITQVLGLTYSALRSVLVRLIGEPAVRYVEGAFDFLRTVVTRGLSAAWEKIREFAGGLADTVIQGIRDWVARSVVGAAITKLVTMFNPVGAIIQAVITTYNTVMFFVERAQQIGRLLGSVVDSIESIARGNVATASDYVERTMANALPVILGFLARFAGLGNIAEPVRTVIQRIRATITNAVERVGMWIADRVRGLLGRRSAETGAATAPGAPVRDVDRPIRMWGEPHTLRAHVEGGRVRFLMASGPFEGLDEKLREVRDLDVYNLKHSPRPEDRAKSPLLEQALNKIEADRKRYIDDFLAAAARGDRNAQDLVLVNGLVALRDALNKLSEDYNLHHRGLRTTGYQHVFAADPTGLYLRATSAQGNPLSRDSAGRGSRSSGIYIPGIDLLNGLQRGHLVANILGGPGDDPRNLAPIVPAANTAMRTGPEKRTKDFIYTGAEDNAVRYHVAPRYGHSITEFQSWLSVNFGLVPPTAAARLYGILATRNPTHADIRASLASPSLSAAQCQRVLAGLAFHFLATSIVISIFVANTGQGNTVPLPTAGPPITNPVPSP